MKKLIMVVAVKDEHEDSIRVALLKAIEDKQVIGLNLGHLAYAPCIPVMLRLTGGESDEV